MNVRELIGALEMLPDDARVLLEDWNEEWADPAELELLTHQLDGTVLLGMQCNAPTTQS